MSCNILTALTYNPPIEGFVVFRNKFKKNQRINTTEELKL